MKKSIIKQLLTVILAVTLAVPQSFGVLAAGDYGDAGKGTEEIKESDPGEGVIFAVGDVSIRKPVRKKGGHTTWDCIWFGNYWQEDTNGDGNCFSKDTTVSEGHYGYVDENGKRIYHFSGKTGTYYADDKQPIKWRVLDVDAEGNALLLSDKLIDIVEYNTDETDITWKDSTIRSYLNSYDASLNTYGTDYSTGGFLNNAFNEAEISAIKKDNVVNNDNLKEMTEGGEDTEDKVFCLSIDEVLNSDYGFSSEPEDDITRDVVTTRFTDNKPGYYGNCDWWLRSPGVRSEYASLVEGDYVSFGGYGVDSDFIFVRPAFRMNLALSSSLWSYAGNVCSDGTVTQPDVAVQGITLTKQRTLKKDSKSTLIPEITPPDAFDRKVTWKVSEGGESIISVDENGVVTGLKEGTATVIARTNDGGHEDSCTITVVSSDSIASPNINKEISTWDCIWFGNYWQEDTNGDGQCFSKDTTVSMNKYDDYYDETGKRLYNFKGDIGTYPADAKQPIKWRVLDIDADGNALLLADKLIDIVQYNETRTNVTWETCTMRSYLNGYDSLKNKDGVDFTGDKSFLYNAFSEPERSIIMTSELTNPDNNFYGTPGGNSTQDKVFCLSLDEAMTAGYGFVKNEFPYGGSTPYCTVEDPTRVAVTTKFTEDKPGYDGNAAGRSDWWWLRSPGYYSDFASYVSYGGVVDAHGNNVDYDSFFARPAFRMNLSSSLSLWTYAGTVSSDGTVNQAGVAVQDITLTEQRTIKKGIKSTLITEIIPSDAFDKKVFWEVSEGGESIVSVDENGVVTGLKEGTATVIARTNDGGHERSCVVTVVGSDSIVDPVIQDGISTWDCVWFGDYWQNSDTNRDGIVDQEDKKDPIKWRVLDIDAEGNAFLLSDRLIDAEGYNTENHTDITWKNSTIRSYLNSYDATYNTCSTDYRSNGFLNNAFSESEIAAIIRGTVVNNDNQEYDTDGGEDTEDKIFCLSIDEVTDSDYGFSSKPDDDFGRVSVITKYTESKGDYGHDVIAGNPEYWWLRSPGSNSYSASRVGDGGEVSAYGYEVLDNCYGLRPAFRMNISSSSSLWDYAGTVCSDGGGDQIGLSVKEISLTKQKTVRVGTSITLVPGIFPSEADDQAVIWSVAEPDSDIVSINKNGVVTGLKEGTATVIAKTHSGGYESSCVITVVGPDGIEDPVFDRNTSTWDCIWFGDYWQDDTNGDGYCFSKDTTVSKDSDDHCVDENGTTLYDFSGEVGTYYADKKQPIKWRVLDVDAEGNALLMSDKLIDIVEYNTDDADIAWKDSTIRSYLNSYNATYNTCGTDFSSGGFLNNAFSKEEIAAIKRDTVVNNDNPAYGTDGGEDTEDKVFCLSIGEVTNSDYGFSPQKKMQENARRAVFTKYTECKPGYYIDYYLDYYYGAWWLRSPGNDSNNASYVNYDGAVNADNDVSDDYCVRPAFRMNLSSFSSLWSYAGTVSSDGTVKEVSPSQGISVTGVSLQKTAKVAIGKTITLTPEISPSYATNRTVTWKSSAEGVATVSTEGVVTGITEGTADITVTTNNGGFTATCKVTVTKDGTDPGPDTVSVNGVTLPATGSVKVGKTITLTPDISPSDATDKTVTWKSSAEGVATVSTEGVVTGITEGTADITVTTNDGGFTATCRVRVTKEGTDPDSDPSEEDLKKDIDVDTADRNFEMLPGEIRRLPINKTGKYVYGVSYVSSDPKTVSVKNGVVTAKNLKKGETEKKATVTATYNGESVPFVITVKASLPAITAGQKGKKISAPKTVKADVGTSKTVTATVKLPKALQGKEVRAKVVLPEDLPGTSVADGATENAFFDLGEGKPDAKGTKVSFVITPREAGAAYIVWTVTDDSGNRSQAYSKVLIKKPISTLSVNCPETGLDLSVGEGQRLIVTTTKGNTDSKDLSFSVKGKGVKVSKSGFVTAVTPGAEADVTVKAGKINKKVSVRVKDHSGSILALNKTSVNVKLPKKGAKPKTAALKVTMPKKNPPEVKWSIANSPKGIAVDPDGKVTVTSDASPGCYTVTATPNDTSSGYNQVCCELIVR